jgi:hypothetical protein
VSYTIYENELAFLSTYSTEELKARNNVAGALSAIVAIVLSWVFATEHERYVTLGSAIAIIFLLLFVLNQLLAARRYEQDRANMVTTIRDESKDANG